jgi:branched-chain amino acid transport system substrate-binding protein
MDRRRLLLAGALGAVVPALPEAARSQSGPAAPIRLGQSAPITGPLSRIGTAFRAAAAAVFAEVDERGGIAGRRVELVTLDDEDRSERTAVNAKLLASEHGVSAFFGFVGAGAHRIGVRAAQEEGLPYIAPVSGAADLQAAAGPGVFTMRASHADEIRYIARHTRQVGIERLALAYEYNSQGWELRDTLIDTLAAEGRGVASITSVDHEGSAYTLPGAIAAIQAGNPQAVVLGADHVASAKLVGALRQAGFGGLFYTLSTVGGRALADLLGPQASGISVTQVVPFPWSEASEVGRAFKRFCRRHELERSFEAMEAWLAATLLVDGLRRAKQPTPAGIADALRTMPRRDLGGFVAGFASGPREAGAYVDLTVYSRDGRFIR